MKADIFYDIILRLQINASFRVDLSFVTLEDIVTDDSKSVRKGFILKRVPFDSSKSTDEFAAFIKL